MSIVLNIVSETCEMYSIQQFIKYKHKIELKMNNNGEHYIRLFPFYSNLVHFIINLTRLENISSS